MPPDLKRIDELIAELRPFNATLVAVSKTRPAADISTVFQHGHLDFGENYVQELNEKAAALPGNIRWHFIGHLQSNKVKQVVHLAHLIHGIDSLKLLVETGKQSVKAGGIQDVLLQVHIAREESKFGFSEEELMETFAMLAKTPVPGVRIRGLMGMATLTEEPQQVRKEFRFLRGLFDKANRPGSPMPDFDILSMGMSGDYRIALDEGSNMVRIGTAVFGAR